jgi:hypothetical protein
MVVVSYNGDGSGVRCGVMLLWQKRCHPVVVEDCHYRVVVALSCRGSVPVLSRCGGGVMMW